MNAKMGPLKPRVVCNAAHKKLIDTSVLWAATYPMGMALVKSVNMEIV